MTRAHRQRFEAATSKLLMHSNASEPNVGDGSSPCWLGSHSDGSLYRIPPFAGEPAYLLSICDYSDSPTSAIRRLEQAYSLRAQLDSSFATVPLRLTQFDGRPALLQTDPGGQPLELSEGQPWPLQRLLETALAIVHAVGRLHERRLVHQELRPGNLLLDDQGRVYLTGFSHTSTETRIQQVGNGPIVSSDSQPYMAPEQTGRIHRCVDTRADLYAVGIILYRMACGEFPFEVTDAAEWAHCHIAWAPIAPSLRDERVPEALSGIILKLLAKHAEDRYQTAIGLEADLRLCINDYDRTGTVKLFTLGQEDRPDRLVISEQLFGRDRILDQIVNQYQRVATSGRSELLLISGYSGVGKSALVGEFRGVLSSQKARFAGGKFEQHKSDIPYSTFAQALRQLVSGILTLDDKALATWRQRLLAALDECGQAIVNLVPELEHVIGRQPPLKEVLVAEGNLRFQVTVQRFLSVFSDEYAPLILFLDDIHWIDSASLDLLSSLLSNSELRYVLLIGAYRSNEVDESHPLSARIRHLQQTRSALVEVELHPLTLSELEGLVLSSLHDDSGYGSTLAKLIWKKTGGNPLFSKQLLAELAEQRLLRFDPQLLRWIWDTEAIEALDYSQNIAELVARKIQRLSDKTRQLLLFLACLGTNASVQSLVAITGQSHTEVSAQLESAVDAGLVSQNQNNYRFLHDKIQEAAYATLPVQERASMHLFIARQLHRRETIPSQGRDSLLFDMVNQYLRGDGLIEATPERLQVAELYLRAARNAMADTAYAAAIPYLARGQSLLPLDGWQRNYKLCFDLSKTQAECEFYAGDPATADHRLKQIANKAKGLVDQAGLTALQITVCLALDDSARAISTCLNFLGDVDAPWPAHPSRKEVLQEYEALQKRLQERTIASLVDLPPMVDPLRLAVMDVLAAVLPPAFFSDENLVCLVLCRMANLSIDYGNTNASPLAYAYLGMMVGPYFHDYPAAFELGKLGYDLVERGEHTRYRARIYMCFAYHVIPWTQDMRETLPLLRAAFKITRETGDITYSGFTSCTLVTSMLFSGLTLDLIEVEGTQRLELMLAARFGLIVDIMTTQLRLVAMLQGRTDRFGYLDGGNFNEAEFEAHLEANRSLDIAACWYWIRKAQGRYLAGNNTEALQALHRAEPLMWSTKGHLEFAEYHLYGGLIHAAACHGANEATYAEHSSMLDLHLAQHAEWAAYGPSNFACRHALLAAEAARLRRDDQAALQLYDDSARLAHQAGMGHIEALAFELAARFHAEGGRQALAMSLRRSSREVWLSWGARGKAAHLEGLHTELAPRPERPRTTALSRPLRAMDVETLLRISQALAAEKGLDRLVQTLMTMTLEYAGADRALLVLPHGDQLRVEASAQASRESVSFRIGNEASTSTDIPLSVLHYALRTRTHVLIDDARQPGPFSTDLYLMHAAARSVLCLPLMRRGEPVGVLYLENSFTGHVFTADRVGVLALVALMAATSMENASLGEKESLLQEVHHRVKNNLQLISSLLSLQASRITEPAVSELFSESRNRVRSMALVHENLYRAGNFARVPMATHLSQLCTQLSHVYGLDESRVRMCVHIDDIELSLSQAVSCGLIVNELVSNALKHAFPGGRCGKISVRMCLTSSRRYELAVADDGIGLPPHIEPAQVESLGLQLVEDLSHQLRGSLTVQRGSGTRFLVEFGVAPDSSSTTPTPEKIT